MGSDGFLIVLYMTRRRCQGYTFIPLISHNYVKKERPERERFLIIKIYQGNNILCRPIILQVRDLIQYEQLQVKLTYCFNYLGEVYWFADIGVYSIVVAIHLIPI